MKKTLTALTLGAVLSTATIPAASALENASYASNKDEASTVATFQVTNSGNPAGDCTATAISEQWAITAHHCVQAQPELGGKLRFGEEGNYRYYDVDYWESAPDQSDLALVHTTEKIDLDHYASLQDSVLTPGEGTLYGWSEAGMGKSGKLPQATTSITQESLDQYGISQSNPSGEYGIIQTKMVNQEVLQGGDSGGPFFKDGKVAGVITASTSDSPGSEAILTPVAGKTDWITQRISTAPTDEEKADRVEKMKEEEAEYESAEAGAAAQAEGGSATQSTEAANQAEAASEQAEGQSATGWVIGGVITVLILVSSLAITKFKKKKEG